MKNKIIDKDEKEIYNKNIGGYTNEKKDNNINNINDSHFYEYN